MRAGVFQLGAKNKKKAAHSEKTNGRSRFEIRNISQIILMFPIFDYFLGSCVSIYYLDAEEW